MNLVSGPGMKLVWQQLQLCRVDGESKGRVATFDAAQELRESLEMIAPEALKKELDLSREAPDALSLNLDLNAFRSIVHNLIGNAVLYVPANGHIAVSLAVDGAYVVLTVADDGPGIAESQRELVFERFYRGTGHDVAGTGLGLAIVKQACTKLGGLVRIESGIGGRGAAFVVHFPRPPDA